MDRPEYLEFRCCMCPNGNDTPQNRICPPKPDGQGETPCRFVKTYIDKRGWLYRVMPGLGESNFKARYQKPGKSGWKCCANLEWRELFDKAQSDLNALAEAKGWEEHNETDI